MVQLSLPKNSRLVESKVWPKPYGAKRTTRLKVYRWPLSRLRWTETIGRATCER